MLIDFCLHFIANLEGALRNQNYRRRISSPSSVPVPALPSFYVENVDKKENSFARNIALNPRNKYWESESIAQDIVPLGQVSIELANSSFGEKLILVRNSRPPQEGRRRSISLSQSDTNFKRLEGLFGALKSNCKSGTCDEQDGGDIVGNTQITTAKARILKSTTDDEENKTTRQARLDQIHQIHDYFQSPQIIRRRRVQSN